MNLELTENESAKLSESGIESLLLFGSQAQGIANEASDYDFFVIGRKTSEAYDFLYDLLSEKINKLADIDIVFDTDAPLELKNHVSKYGRVLFERNPSIFANFRAKTMIECADFAPYRTMFSNATLARIS